MKTCFYTHRYFSPSGFDYRSARGFTLLEVLISVAIFSVMLTALFSYLNAMTDHVSIQTVFGELDTNANRAVSDMAKIMSDARIVSPAAGQASSVAFIRHPIHTDDPSTYTLVDGKSTPQFGLSALWSNEEEDHNGYISFFFAKDDDVSESKYGDINGDGDTSDTYARGWLVKKWVNEDTGDDRESYILNNVLQVEGNDLSGYGGDINGDGADDPIFSMASDGSRILTISLWVWRQDRHGRQLLHHATTDVRSQN